MNIPRKLRRLPHTFSRVLELPLRSDAEVLIRENDEGFRFIAMTGEIGKVSAHVIESVLGITKILIIGSNVLELSWDALEIDKWRFRLPSNSRPEKVRAGYADGRLVVTVPKCIG